MRAPFTLLTPESIRKAVLQQDYVLSLHADDERLADGVTMTQLEHALTNCAILENYPDDPRGPSCLALGTAGEEGMPIHAVCGCSKAGQLVIITVYKPTMPKWKDPFTRNRSSKG